MTAGDADYQVQFEQAGARLCSLCGSVDARCRRRHLDVSYEMTRLNRSGEEKLCFLNGPAFLHLNLPVFPSDAVILIINAC